MKRKCQHPTEEWLHWHTGIIECGKCHAIRYEISVNKTTYAYRWRKPKVRKET